MEQPLVRRLTIRSLPLAAVALPGAVLAAASLALLMITPVAGHPMWPTQPVNMSEAAALRDAATVLQLVRAGENPGERRPIRAGYLLERSVTLTPLEAAIAAGRGEIVDVLLGAGEAATPAEWTRARCLASSVRDADIERVLDAYKPADSPDGAARVDCGHVVRPW